ncbi:MAG: DASH family cryptochrome [Bacteroidota bacterium]
MQYHMGLLWLRNDLRLHDHEALSKALGKCEKVVPVYCLDPRHFNETPFGFPKTGVFRAKFLSESLQSLALKLKEKNSGLLIRVGKPEEILPSIAKEYEAKAVFYHKEITHEETQVEESLEERLFQIGVNFEGFWGSTLYHIDDLPMPVSALPEIFTQFRKQVEKLSSPRELIPTPKHIPSPQIPDTDIAAMAYLQAPTLLWESRSVLSFKGGEAEAFNRLHNYFWESDSLKVYKETRNGLLGENYSSKFSPWLAHGCISPRKIYHEVKRYENLRVKNSSTYWLIFELIWRDYFKYVAKKHKNTLFFPGGIKDERPDTLESPERLEKWIDGNTGIPFVDANMRELKRTGFMSNRGRQNVASFLVKDLQLDWRAGAEYFESQLIDYDVCSNWGNWNYVAGIGNDPRENRYFNVVSQAKRYDPRGEYVRTWIPELEELPSAHVHEPHKLPTGQLKNFALSLGSSYPYPIVKLAGPKSSHAKKKY